MNFSDTKKRGVDSISDGIIFNLWDKVKLQHDCASDLKKGNEGIIVDRYGTPPARYIVEFPKQETSGLFNGVSLALVDPTSKKIKR